MNKSAYEKVIQLNSTYKPLIKRAAKCQELLKSANISTQFVWANNHYEQYKDKYICETYPIPIVEIEGIGDVGFDLHGCFYEGYFAKEKLLIMDLDLLKNIGYFALYGESDYLTDLYNSSMDCNDIKRLIADSADKNIAINFAFKYKDLEKTINLLLQLTKMAKGKIYE